MSYKIAGGVTPPASRSGNQAWRCSRIYEERRLIGRSGCSSSFDLLRIHEPFILGGPTKARHAKRLLTLEGGFL